MSAATDLIPGYVPSAPQVYVADRSLGTIELISQNSLGVAGDLDSTSPSISADGAYVAFESASTNLVGGIPSGIRGIFVRDRINGVTVRANVDSAGNEANFNCYAPSISGNGRFVAFETQATNLVAGDTNGSVDVFVHDLLTGATIRASVSTAGVQANSASYSAALSFDGTYVAFQSDASNLISAGTSSARSHVYRHNNLTGETALVSQAAGVQGNDASQAPSISGDGRYVAYESVATNLVPNGGSAPHVYRTDCSTGTNVRVSVSSAGVVGNDWSYQAEISADGNYVVFKSFAKNLVPNDTSGSGIQDAFVRDIAGQTTVRVNLTLNDQTESSLGFADALAISQHGEAVLFTDVGSTLVPGDTNGVRDVFAVDGVGTPNAVPVLTSVTPNTGNAGDGNTTIDLIGQNFVAGSVVKWNGSPRPTTFISGTEVKAVLSSGDLAAATVASIQVYNPPPVGGWSNSLPFTVNSVNNPVPSLTTLSPDHSTAGGAGFALTVNGTQFVSTSKVRWNGADRATTYVSATQLAATIPAADIATAGTASVTVFSPTPGGGTSNALTFTINNAAPVLTSLSPSSATAGGLAFTLTVNGTGFLSGATVLWNGSARTTTFVTATKLTASITAADVASGGTASVTATNPSPTVGPSNALTFTVNNPAPVLTSLSPSSATAGGAGFTLTVNGTGFLSGATVLWNGSARTTTFVTATQLTASITAADIAAGGTASVTATNPSPTVGPSNALTFTINNAAPVLTSLSPSSATAGGAGFTLTVNGTGFLSGATVLWNGSARTTTFVTATQLTASIAAADIATAGTASVTATNPSPTVGPSNALTFTINNPAPVLTSLSPSSATAGGAAFTLTVNGTGFLSGATVLWNGTARTTTYVTATQLTASITAADIASGGTASVTATNPSPTVGPSNALTFTINNAAPVLTSLSPSSATAGGAGFTLTVNGTGFLSGATVLWNGSARTTTFVTATQLTASITAADIASAGTASVSATNPSPTVGPSNALTFTINNAAPVLTSLNPSSATAGDPAFTLTVNGTGFLSGATVQWNGTSRSTTFVTATQVTAAITAADVAAAGSALVTVVNPSPTVGPSNALTFTINAKNPVPTLTGISPDHATAGGSAFTLTVTGSDFILSSKVRWNGADRATTFVSGTQLTASITAADIASAGAASVTVFNPTPGGGTSGALTFTINSAAPVLTSLSPSSATAGGAAFTLTVNGTGFLSGATVLWNGSARTTTFVTATQLTASISAADIASAGTASVTATNPSPTVGPSNALTFTINSAPPVLTSLSPSSATLGGAAFTLTVNGTGFLSGATVQWNGSARSTAFLSATQVSASIAAADIASAGTASVTVTNPSPTVGPSNTLAFTINNPAPVLTSINPSGAIAGDPGFVLDVVGSGFIQGSVVRWNGADLATTFVSATELNASVPAPDIAAAGTPSVTVFNPAPGGGASNALTFTVTAPNPVPTATTITPDHATAGDPGFTLTVNGTGFISSSRVRWNGATRTTTFVTANQLTAEITASDIGISGTALVTVFTPAPGGGTSNALTFTINPGTINPVPALTSINPSSAAPGSPDVALTVTGSNFINGSIVRWNGSDLATTYGSATHLSAVIPAADLVSAGTASVTVFNPAPGGGASSALTFTIGSPKILALVAVDLRPGVGSIKSGLGEEYHLFAQFKMSDNSVSDWMDVTALGASFTKIGHGVMVGVLGNIYQSVQRTPESAIITGHFSFNSVEMTSRASLTVYR